jgi:muramoyltetrapeptide carboxypeptidase
LSGRERNADSFGRIKQEYERPRAIGPGATLALISPASVVKAELVERGVAALEQLGYGVKVMPHALVRGPLNYAGPWQDRLSDLHAAYADRAVDAIVCTRGGWGSAELLPHLDRALIAANNKALVGYSDVTSLHVLLHRELRRVSFQGPMAASDFAKDGAGAPDLMSWNAALTGAAGWSLGAETGLRVLRPGRAEGVLSGGCMSIYAEALGTEFAAEARGGVLFLEDVGTHAYQWNRMLLHLRLAGGMRGVTGIVFGDMRQCCAAEDDAVMEETLLYALREFEGPIGIGLRSGHVAGGNVTLPFGVRVRLEFADGMNPRVDFVEAAVTV